MIGEVDQGTGEFIPHKFVGYDIYNKDGQLIKSIREHPQRCDHIEFELGVAKPGESFEGYRELKDILDDGKQPV
jgi:hypothetical protein